MSAHCCYCGDELWSASEAGGVCMACRVIERELEIADAVPDETTEQPSDGQEKKA